MTNKGKFIGGLLASLGLGLASAGVGFYTSKVGHDLTVEETTKEVLKGINQAAEAATEVIK